MLITHPELLPEETTTSLRSFRPSPAGLAVPAATACIAAAAAATAWLGFPSSCLARDCHLSLNDVTKTFVLPSEPFGCVEKSFGDLN